MFRTYQPKKRQRKKEHGFRKRMRAEPSSATESPHREQGNKTIIF